MIVYTVTCRRCGHRDARDGTTCRRCHAPGTYVVAGPAAAAVLGGVAVGTPFERAYVAAGPAAAIDAAAKAAATPGTAPPAPATAPSRGFLLRGRRSAAPAAAPAQGVAWEAVEGRELPRRLCGLPDVDRTLGSWAQFGLAEAFAIILDGAPGAGKSSLALMVLAGLARYGNVVYGCGEEEKEAVQARFVRMGLTMPPGRAWFVEGRDFRAFETVVRQVGAVGAVLDSVSVYTDPALPGDAGSPRQLKDLSVRTFHLAHTVGTTLIAIAHQTKSGDANVPNAVKHEYDAHAQMDYADEADKQNLYRILSMKKNRGGVPNREAFFELRLTDGTLQPTTEARARPPKDEGAL